MQEVEDFRVEAMGNLHNAIVAMVDDSILTLPEVTMVLRMVADDIQVLFEKSVKGV
jgi:hypothetical protein